MKNEIKISLKKLNFWYGSNQILFDVSTEFFSNKITALIGPSGCGKSTLLRCLNRINEFVPYSRLDGSVIFKGKHIYEKDVDAVDIRKKIGMVFQKPNPFPMTIFDNVAYGLRIQNIKEREKLNEIVKESLEKAELWEEVKDRLNLSAFRLSGGQQQRLCIARALAINPEVILMDEPCSALDPIATSKIEKLMKSLKKEHTIIIVTHNMQQARRVSDYTCYLHNGKIIEKGKTDKIFSSPRQKLTKDYINGDFG